MQLPSYPYAIVEHQYGINLALCSNEKQELNAWKRILSQRIEYNKGVWDTEDMEAAKAMERKNDINPLDIAAFLITIENHSDPDDAIEIEEFWNVDAPHN